MDGPSSEVPPTVHSSFPKGFVSLSISGTSDLPKSVLRPGHIVADSMHALAVLFAQAAHCAEPERYSHLSMLKAVLGLKLSHSKCQMYCQITLASAL